MALTFSCLGELPKLLIWYMGKVFRLILSGKKYKLLLLRILRILKDLVTYKIKDCFSSCHFKQSNYIIFWYMISVYL